MRVLHFDAEAGISGDMTLGALVDLGVPLEELRRELGKMNLAGWSLRAEREARCGITGTKVTVVLEDEHHHDHNHDHHTEHEHLGDHSHHHWSEIRHIIEDSALSGGAKKRAVAIFTKIAEAEAAVHGGSAEDVAFHEVGALDSIIDIVGTAICLDMLSPDKITSGPPELGAGHVHCAHGILPVPAPAVVLLTENMPVTRGNFAAEMTTPTGAGILAAEVDEFVYDASGIAHTGVFVQGKTGIGIGGREFPGRANVLRVSWREFPESAVAPASTNSDYRQTESVTVLECAIDDMTGEALGFLMESLFEAGALDVTLAPCVMKKSRPGTIVTVLATAEKRDALRHVLFERSSTLGFREYEAARHFLPRHNDTFRGLRRKTARLADGRTRGKIEADDRAKIAREKNVGLDEVEAIMYNSTK